MKNILLSICIAAMAGGLPLMAIADNTYNIYPVPQEEITGTGTVNITSSINIITETGIDAATKNRIEEILKAKGLEYQFSSDVSPERTNIFIGINGSGQAADRMAGEMALNRDVFNKDNKYDRHCLNISSQNGTAQIIILGENTDAAFYGLASLEQILDHGTELKTITLYDYADQKNRGIVEGYYGYPYSMEVKKDLMHFMMRYKMNTYLYGAKSDPYHSQYWKEPYPTQLTEEQIENGWLSQDGIKEIAATSQATKVNFIWAIHPGNDIIYSTTVVNDVLSKFDKMYQLGIRQFAVFVDDVGIPSNENDLKTNADNISNIQKGLEGRYNQTGVQPADTVKPLHFVPQIYCTAFASDQQRQQFFKALSTIPENISVYTTGWGVWSVPNVSDLQRMQDEFGRPAAWWWNYPCNDNADGQIYPMDMYSNFRDMPSVSDNATLPQDLNNGLGIVCNPMQQGEVSKIPIFSVADFAWNNSAFNNLESWASSFPAIVGTEKANSLQLLAHYLRYNDPEELNTLINQYKASLRSGTPSFSVLKEKLDAVSVACADIQTLKDSPSKSDRLLHKDLAPWLYKLEQMVSSVNQLLSASAMPNEDDAKWTQYIKEIPAINGLDTAEIYKAYALEGMGNGISVSVRPSQPSHKYLYPFTYFLKENALGDFFQAPVTKTTKITNKENAVANVAQVQNLVFFSSCRNVMNKGEYIGLALPSPTLLDDITIADTLLANNSIIYSTNGKQWFRFSSKEEALKTHIKYICVEHTHDTPKYISLSRKVLCLTLPQPTEIGNVTIPNGNIWDGHEKTFITDGDYGTFCCLNRNQQNGDSYTVELSEVQPIHDVRICMGTVNNDYMNVGSIEISKDGTTWKRIPFKGTQVYDFRMNFPLIVKYSDEMSYGDFDGNGQEGKYVRLNLKQPNTSKWLRLYEIEVNKKHDQQKYRATCTDYDGNNQPEATDGIAHTSVKPEGTPLIYYFDGIQFLKAIEFYLGSPTSSSEPAKISITKDYDTWTEIGELTGNKQVFDLSGHHDAVALKINRSGQSPAIYEIVEIKDENQQAEVTGNSIIHIPSAPTEISLNKGVISINAQYKIKTVEIFSTNGQLTGKYNFAGLTRVQIPVSQQKSTVSVVRISFENGKQISHKIYVNN